MNTYFTLTSICQDIKFVLQPHPDRQKTKTCWHQVERANYFNYNKCNILLSSLNNTAKMEKTYMLNNNKLINTLEIYALKQNVSKRNKKLHTKYKPQPSGCEVQHCSIHFTSCSLRGVSTYLLCITWLPKCFTVLKKKKNKKMRHLPWRLTYYRR